MIHLLCADGNAFVCYLADMLAKYILMLKILSKYHQGTKHSLIQRRRDVWPHYYDEVV